MLENKKMHKKDRKGQEKKKVTIQINGILFI